MVKLALLWHMHQPYYEDLASGEHILPWVRLHALKDYWGMVAMLREFPEVRATFNLVPSLLVQLEAFAADRAHDRHLIIGLKPAEALERDEREFLIANGFHAQFDRMIRPYPRYAALHTKRSRREPFSTADLRDLQVLHKLVWMDPDKLADDHRLRDLAAKGQNYSEADKKTLRDVELELLNAVIPEYRAAATRGQVELSTTPFYHPILPLLCDTDVHLRAHAESPIPRGLFSAPADARVQLARAFDHHAALFGTPADGVWPSEGSLSDEVIRLLAETGCRWTATDENLLQRSLRRPITAVDLYQPYVLGSGERTVRALFRDHQLSDLIGFGYQTWDAAAAAADFLARVRDAGRRFQQQGGHGSPVVAVILDGENAWEHYADGGRPFLRALYKGLEDASDIVAVTMSEAVKDAASPLPSVFPGSWINADFYIWAGHRDDHRAWAQLAAARRACDEATGRVSPDAEAQALEELLIAEGSDWFWWYGDDHSSDHDREFDELFRRHLRNVYQALGRPAPDELHLSNISTRSAATVGPVAFPGLSSPVLDGKGDFVAWAAALELVPDAGVTMHRVNGRLTRKIRIGADLEQLYFRFEGPGLGQAVAAGEISVAVLSRGADSRLSLQPTNGGSSDVVVAAVPLSRLRVQPGALVGLSILLTDAAGHVLEQHPGHQPLELQLPTRSHRAVAWVV